MWKLWEKFIFYYYKKPLFVVNLILISFKLECFNSDLWNLNFLFKISCDFWSLKVKIFWKLMKFEH